MEWRLCQCDSTVMQTDAGSSSGSSSSSHRTHLFLHCSSTNGSAGTREPLKSAHRRNIKDRHHRPQVGWSLSVCLPVLLPHPQELTLENLFLQVHKDNKPFQHDITCIYSLSSQLPVYSSLSPKQIPR